MTSQSFQQYVRIVIYMVFSALTSNGITTPENTKTLILGIAGLLANILWTAYGTRLNALLQQVKEKTGVQEVQIKVDPELLSPAKVNDNTSEGITAVPAQVMK